MYNLYAKSVQRNLHTFFVFSLLHTPKNVICHIIILQFYKFYTNPCRLLGKNELVKGINITTTRKGKYYAKNIQRAKIYLWGLYRGSNISCLYPNERSKPKEEANKRNTEKVKQTPRNRPSAETFAY